MRFFVGLHIPSAARHFEAVCLSVHVLRRRRSFIVNDWIMDSGAFSTLQTHGDFCESPLVYAAEIRRWRECGHLLAAVTQDYMCEPMMLARTGQTVTNHQYRTIARYDALLEADTGVYILPVLQGYHPQDYVRHLGQYGARLGPEAWVGVGSVCKRQAHPKTIALVLRAIHSARPDLRLHGFGVKFTALASPLVREHLWSADSMAWSYSARKQGRNANDWQEAAAFVTKVQRRTTETALDALPLFV